MQPSNLITQPTKETAMPRYLTPNELIAALNATVEVWKAKQGAFNELPAAASLESAAKEVRAAIDALDAVTGPVA